MKFKIKNEGQFKDELRRLNGKFLAISENFPKGKQMIIDRLNILYNIVTNNEKIPGNQKAAANLLPFLEFIGGKEFLEQSQDGKDIIEVFFYFAYKWHPAGNPAKS